MHGTVIEKLAEAFLQRYAAGKRTTAKFTDVELWPIVRNCKCFQMSPLLLEKLLKRARDTGNERLLAYIFRNAAHLRALETCDEKLEASYTSWSCESC